MGSLKKEDLKGKDMDTKNPSIKYIKEICGEGRCYFYSIYVGRKLTQATIDEYVKHQSPWFSVFTKRSLRRNERIIISLDDEYVTGLEPYIDKPKDVSDYQTLSIYIETTMHTDENDEHKRCELIGVIYFSREVH